MRGIVGRFGLFLSLLAITLLFAGTVWLAARHWRPSVESYPHQGVDVSAKTGPVAWDAVRVAGAMFGYVRATDGTTRDARFEENWRAVADAGLRRGAIHRWSLCAAAVDQANAFVITVPRAADSLPPALELDFVEGCAARPDRAAVIAEIGRFIAMVEAHSDRPVVLAVSHRFESAYRVSEAFDRPVWAIGDFFPPDYAARRWRMWRATDMRRIDGVTGPINWDVVAK